MPARKIIDHGCFLELYHAGLSDAKIAAALGVSQYIINTYRRRHGLETHYPNYKRRRVVKNQLDKTVPDHLRGRLRLLLLGMKHYPGASWVSAWKYFRQLEYKNPSANLF
jgi:hypothetical protein